MASRPRRLISIYEDGGTVLDTVKAALEQELGSGLTVNQTIVILGQRYLKQKDAPMT